MKVHVSNNYIHKNFVKYSEYNFTKIETVFYILDRKDCKEIAASLRSPQLAINRQSPHDILLRTRSHAAYGRSLRRLSETGPVP